MALSMVTRGMIGPIEDGIDLITFGQLWRNRYIGELIEKLALMTIEFSANKALYPELDLRSLMFALIEKTTDIYDILSILARGGFADYASDLF